MLASEFIFHPHHVHADLKARVSHGPGYGRDIMTRVERGFRGLLRERSIRVLETAQTANKLRMNRKTEKTILCGGLTIQIREHSCSPVHDSEDFQRGDRGAG
jgi:hypothetical protein